jgi:hypothetical protein
MKNKLKLYSIIIMFLVGWYYVVTFNYIEYKRINLVSAMEEKIKTSSWKIDELKKELEKEELELNSASECKNKNYNTWSYIDCNTIQQSTVIPNKYEKLNKHICASTNSKSPLCNNIKLVKELEKISNKKWVNFMLMIWITYAESTLGSNYAKGCDTSYYNMWGIKWRLDDEWKKIKDQPIPSSSWCWLYKFKSYEDYWNSKANSLYFGYIKKGCDKISCISKWYVRWDWLYKSTYNDRVNVFAEYKF